VDPYVYDTECLDSECRISLLEEQKIIDLGTRSCLQFVISNMNIMKRN